MEAKLEIRPVDRIMLVMLSEIYDALKIRGEINTEFLRGVIFGGRDWALEWDMSGLTTVEPDDYNVVKEVVDILDMYDMLELSFDDLKPADRPTIEEYLVRFPGFDGNNETAHMGIARFLVDDMGRWSRFKGKDFNSHHETLTRAREMLRRYNPLRAKTGSRSLPRLTPAEIVEIASRS